MGEEEVPSTGQAFGHLPNWRVSAAKLGTQTDLKCSREPEGESERTRAKAGKTQGQRERRGKSLCRSHRLPPSAHSAHIYVIKAKFY